MGAALLLAEGAGRRPLLQRRRRLDCRRQPPPASLAQEHVPRGVDLAGEPGKEREQQGEPEIRRDGTVFLREGGGRVQGGGQYSAGGRAGGAAAGDSARSKRPAQPFREQRLAAPLAPLIPPTTPHTRVLRVGRSKCAFVGVGEARAARRAGKGRRGHVYYFGARDVSGLTPAIEPRSAMCRRSRGDAPMRRGAGRPCECHKEMRAAGCSESGTQLAKK